MMYKFWRKHRIDGDDIVELDLEDRAEALDYLKAHKAELQKFSDRGTGSIFGWCVELDDKDRTRALLYEHPEHGLIWIDLA